MRDIWNPWHGCVKYSEGCEHCYMYYLDKQRDKDGSVIYRTKTNFNYPLQKHRDGSFKIKSGEMLRVCMTSDFCLEEADGWRDEVWDMIRYRSDVKFFILTKRAERLERCLPRDWGDGWDNVILNVTCENQRRADERLPILLGLPARHKGCMCAPLIGPVRIGKYLASGQIEQVICTGENYDGARPCDYDWIKGLHDDCRDNDITFAFGETGTVFIKDGVRYEIPSKRLQTILAYESRLSYKGRDFDWILKDPGTGRVLGQCELRQSTYDSPNCKKCACFLTCGGCSGCGKCGYKR